MPKIPLYEEKIGQQKLAAGPLSRRADVSAFAAPALAVANFGKTVNQIAFDFGMEERRKEDEDTVKKLNNQFAEESAEWIRKNPRENTQVFKADFEKFKNEFVDFYATNLSSRRSRLVKNKINQTAAILNLQGQEKAYALSEKNATARDKNLLAVAADAMINSPLDSPEFTIALDNSNKIFEDAKLYGRNLGTTKYAYGLSITKGMYTKTAEDINSTTSLQDFKDRLSKNKELIPTEKAPLIALAEANFKDYQNATIDKIMDGMMVSEVSPEEYLKISASLLKGQKKFTYNDGDELIPVDVSGFDSDGIKTLQATMSVQTSAVAANNLRVHSRALQNYFKINPNLSSLKNKRDQIDRQEGEYAGLTLGVRDSLLSVVDSRITKQKVIAKSKFDANNELIKNNIKVDQGISEETNNLIKTNSALAQSLDVGDSTENQDKYTNSVKSLTEGVGLFETLKRADNNEVQKVLLDLTRKEKQETNSLKKKQISDTKEILNNLVVQRAKEIKERPYEYFQNLLNEDKNPEDVPATHQEIHDAQVEAGVPFKDRRLISKRDEDSFTTEYKLQDSLTARGEVFDKFFARYNLTEQDQILKNIIRRKGLTLADNLFLAQRDNLVNADIFVSQSDDVKKQVTKLGKTETDDIFNKTVDLLADYSESVSGVMTTDYTFGQQTGTRATVNHSVQMQNLVSDLAGYYRITGKLTNEEAVTLAVDAVINNQYDFIRPAGGGSVRLEKGLSGQILPAKVETILNAVVSDDLDFIKNLNIRGPRGQDQKQYIREVLSKGSFHTKGDGSGVILVDMTGNPVMVTKVLDGDEGVSEMPFTLTFQQIADSEEFYDIETNEQGT